MDIYPEHNLLINCCKISQNSLDDKMVSHWIFNRAIDWNFVESESFYHEIASFLYKRLEGLGFLKEIPEKVAIKLKHSYIRTIFRNDLLLQEYNYIYRAMLEEDIECLPLKGVAFLGYLYEDVGLRPMCDIDIIVKDDMYGGAERFLQKLRYKKVSSEDGSHIVFFNSEKAIMLELHIDRNYAFEDPRRIVIPGVWDRAVTFEKEGISMKRMSPEDMLFSLAMHSRRMGKLFIIKYLCDIDRCIRKNQNKLDWDFIIENARRFKIISPCFILLKTAKDIFSAPLPDGLEERICPTTMRSFILKRAIKKALFVKKGKERAAAKHNYLIFYLFLQDGLILPFKHILLTDK